MSSSSPADDAPAGWAEVWGGGRGLTFAILCFGIWLNAVDALVTATVMPSVAGDIGGYAVFAWPTAGFMLGSILAGAGAGLLAERIGLRRALAGSGLLYALGCVGSAAAGSIWIFLAGRLVQGLGAGFTVGLCYVSVRAVFAPRLWSPVFASLSGVWGVATVLGPLAGGLFAGAHLWRAVFWLFAGQGVLFALAVRALPRAEARGGGQPTGLPVVQLLVLTLAVVLVAVAGVLDRPAPAAALVAAGLALLVLALRLDARAQVRLLPAACARIGSAPARGYAAILCFSASAIAFSVYGAGLLQARLGLTPLQAGYVVASESIGWTVTALLVAHAGPERRGSLIRLGGLVIVAGVAGCALTLSRSGVALVSAAGAVMGGGFGLCWSFIAQRILNALPEEEGAIGSAAIPMMQILGNAVGAAAAGVLADLLGLAHGFAPRAAAEASPVLLGVFVPVALVGLGCAWGLGRRQPA